MPSSGCRQQEEQQAQDLGAVLENAEEQLLATPGRHALDRDLQDEASA